MNPEKQRIEIAEACGLPFDVCACGALAEQHNMSSNHAFCAQERLPDYLNDLNAMHDAEKSAMDRPLRGDEAHQMKPHYVGKNPMDHDGLLYTIGECKAILSGPLEREQIGWHFSISHPTRDPTWEEQRDFRYALIPDDVYMVSIMPPKKEYVNLHKFCFHWHEAGPKFFDVKTGRPLS